MFDAVGHASMQLSAPPGGTPTYISWWPHDQDRKTIPFVGLAFDAPHYDDQTYEEDVSLEGTVVNGVRVGKEPDLALSIWNLDEHAALDWWQPYNADPSNRWNALASNCSTIVFKALQAGGALQGLSAGEMELYCQNLPWTPNDVAALMMLLQSKHSAHGVSTKVAAG